MAKKGKHIEDINEDLDNLSEESDEGYFNATAYLPVFNEDRKAFDMYLVRVDTINKKAFVEIEKMRYDTEARALHDLMSRLSSDFIKKPTKKRK